MPEELTATLERGTWTPAPVFDLVRRAWATSRSRTSRPPSTAASGWSRCSSPDARRRAPIALLDELRDPRLGGRRGQRPRRWRRTAARSSAWSVSTPAGADCLPTAELTSDGCAGTTTQQVALSPRELFETVREPRCPGRVCEGADPMGRGRAKAKQTKVARDLKYRTHETDFGALASELHKESDSPGGPGRPRGAREVVGLRRPLARLIPPSPRASAQPDPA